MPKRNAVSDFDLDDDEESGVEIDLAIKPSRKFAGTDDQLKDAETGEAVFDDITPALRKVKAEEVDEEQEDEDLDEEADDEDEDEPRPRVVVQEDEEGDGKPRRNKGWQARVERERRLKDEAREEVSELRARLDRIEQGQQLEALERKHNSFVSKTEGEINAVTGKLKQAMEDGDTDQQIKLNKQLNDLQIELRAQTIVFEGKKTAAETAAKAAPQVSGDAIVTRKVNAWKRKHGRYNTDKSFQGFVKGVDAELCAEGFDPETDEFYEELDKRVGKRYPEEYRGQAKPRPRRQAPSQTLERNTAPTRPTQAGSFKRVGTKVTLTPRQARNMRQFGLDPENANDVRDYVRENS